MRTLNLNHNWRDVKNGISLLKNSILFKNYDIRTYVKYTPLTYYQWLYYLLIHLTSVYSALAMWRTLLLWSDSTIMKRWKWKKQKQGRRKQGEGKEKNKGGEKKERKK